MLGGNSLFRGWWGTSTGFSIPGGGHGPKRVGVFGRRSEICGLTLRLPCVELGVALEDSHGSFPAQKAAAVWCSQALQYLLTSSKTCCSARGAGQRWQFFPEPSYFLQCGSWYKSPLPSLSSSLMHIHQYAERERNPRTNRKARKENETKKAELRAVLSRVMFCWSGRYEQRFIGLFEQELNGVSSLTAE